MGGGKETWRRAGRKPCAALYVQCLCPARSRSGSGTDSGNGSLYQKSFGLLWVYKQEPARIALTVLWSKLLLIFVIPLVKVIK